MHFSRRALLLVSLVAPALVMQFAGGPSSGVAPAAACTGSIPAMFVLGLAPKAAPVPLNGGIWITSPTIGMHGDPKGWTYRIVAKGEEQAPIALNRSDVASAVKLVPKKPFAPNTDYRIDVLLEMPPSAGGRHWTTIGNFRSGAVADTTAPVLQAVGAPEMHPVGQEERTSCHPAAWAFVPVAATDVSPLFYEVWIREDGSALDTSGAPDLVTVAEGGKITIDGARYGHLKKARFTIVALDSAGNASEPKQVISSSTAPPVVDAGMTTDADAAPTDVDATRVNAAPTPEPPRGSSCACAAPGL